MFSFNELAGRQPAGVKKTAGTVSGRFAIKKADEDKHLAFGWAYVSQDEGGNQTEDHSGDQLEPEELESAAYQFVELYREGGEMHERGGCAVLVESMVFSKEKQQALGIPDGTCWLVDRFQGHRRGRVGQGERRDLPHVQYRGDRRPGGDRGMKHDKPRGVGKPASFCLYTPGRKEEKRCPQD